MKKRESKSSWGRKKGEGRREKSRQMGLGLDGMVRRKSISITADSIQDNKIGTSRVRLAKVGEAETDASGRLVCAGASGQRPRRALVGERRRLIGPSDCFGCGKKPTAPAQPCRQVPGSRSQGRSSGAWALEVSSAFLAHSKSCQPFHCLEPEPFAASRTRH